MLEFKMMLVIATDDDGENADLIVIARSADEARFLWRKYWLEYHSLGLDERHEIDRNILTNTQAIWSNAEPGGIRIIPTEELLTQSPRAIPWLDVPHL